MGSAGGVTEPAAEGGEARETSGRRNTTCASKKPRDPTMRLQTWTYSAGSAPLRNPTSHPSRSPRKNAHAFFLAHAPVRGNSGARG